MSAAADSTPKTPLLNKQTSSAFSKPRWRLYWELARMHKFPSGSILVFWPCIWGYLLGTRGNPSGVTTLARYFIAFLIGSTLLHSAACTINDICDRDFDRQVERCKNRPIASGAVTVFQATVFLLLQVGIFVLMLTQANRTAFLCGLFGVFPLHAFYPLMKRVTNWPQAWLGLAMNWGLPTAWLMTRPEDINSVPMWALTFGTFCWTIFYDTIYACQDRKDDVEAGVKSTALLFGAYVKPILSLFGAVFVGTLAYAGIATGMPQPYFIISVGGCALHMIWQLGTLDVDTPEDCCKKFNSNGDLGYIVAGGMLAAMYTPDLFVF
ncbi:4-hydroxybenzoate polyprenyl transferase [Daedalea quercina L-15889]|uniref:4-hydroxybenzoate polyprenyltransferase, mitochondrial n=1 Tax=Daedalea quercina L-15889 TaxID=1314783 RepID=A0A165MSA0_9APHY|nr:4-hydroxybenzoate polyprenyl transferase [Daedalea quercina L-15889]